MLEDACKEVADLCVHCHMCRLECPANVDIPKLMLEAKATYVRTNGLPLHDRLLARIDSLAGARRPAAGRSPIGRSPIRRPAGCWRKMLGIAQGRKLPRLARRSFLQECRDAPAAAIRPVGTGEKVVYFVDTYANHFDTQLAEALVAVLRHNGVAVFVPTDQHEAAMPMISQGVLEPARGDRPAERRAAGRGGAAGLQSDRHRTVGRAGADARVSDASRRRRRRRWRSPRTRRRPATICGNCTSAAG